VSTQLVTNTFNYLDTQLFQRLAFKVKLTKTRHFLPGKKGFLINKDNQRFPYRIVNCADGIGEVLIPRQVVINLGQQIGFKNTFKIFK
jgi:hypothetical protein